MTILTQTDYNGPELQYIPIHTACWALVFFILSFVAFIFIPIFFQNHLTTSSGPVTQPQRSSISLKRYLIGSFGLVCIMVVFIIVTEQSDSSRHLPITTHIFFIAIDLLLAYHLTEKDARTAAKKYLFYLFNIQESNADIVTTGSQHIHGSNRAISQQSPMMETALFTISNRRNYPVNSPSPMNITDIEKA